MKKLLPLLVVAMLASCSQVQEGDVNATVGAGVTISVDLPQTRTSLSDKDENGDYLVYWSAEDKLVANGSPSTNIIIKEDKISAQFSYGINVGISPYHLTYPYNEDSSCANGKPTVVFEAEQIYTEGTFGVGYAPMCGYSENLGTTVLKHLAGVLRLSPYGNTTLSKIEIIAAEGVALAGEFDVDCQTGAITAIEGETNNKITYTINKALATDADGAEPFFIVIPTGNPGLCDVILTNSQGSQMKLKWNGTNVLGGQVREFKPFEFKVGEASFEPASNEIWYTTTDGAVVAPYMSNVFGADIASNTYENGKGVITFDAPVTSIGHAAFAACGSLTSVTIPDSVTSIGDAAFLACGGLTNITIPENVTSIGNEAFSECSSLTSVTIPDSVTEIGGYAFIACNHLTTITIPNGVTSIGGCTFYYCSSLTSVTIPDSVTEIGSYAFFGCSSLTSVTIPNGVTSIWEGTFKGCSSLKAFYGKFASSDNRCLIVDGVLNSFAPAGLTEYTIPDSVTSIGNEAFRNCSSLTSITIPDSVTSIGDWAFNYCSSLTSVTIPDSVTSIGDYAFAGCSSLTSVYCKPITPPTGDSCMFSSNASGRKIYVPTASVEAYKTAKYWSKYADYIFPDATESTNNKIFYTSSNGAVVEPNATGGFGANIVSNVYENGKGVITFDGEVTSIGHHAFRKFSSLTSITIPDSVTSIGEYAFLECTSLTSVTIGNSVTSIGMSAFHSCSSLTSITIPDSVTSIGLEAFYECTSLKEVYCKPTTPPTGSFNMFSYDNSGEMQPIGCKIYVPTESVEAYKAAQFWSDYAEYIEEKEF